MLYRMWWFPYNIKMNDICISVFLFWLTTSTPLFCGWNPSKTNLDIRWGGGGPVNTVMSGFDEEVADVMAVAVTGGGRGVYVLRQSRVYVVPKLHVT